MLRMLATLQAVNGPGWVGPVVAISLVVVALSFAAIAIGVLIVASRLIEPVQQLSRVIASLQDDLAWSLKGLRQLTEQSQELLTVVRQEAGAFAQTGRQLRRRIERGVDRIQTRLADLETLYDVVHEEVEETALDVASALRTVRTGSGVVARLRRLLVPQRR
jgi:predicted PurR-regulated permease PerM